MLRELIVSVVGGLIIALILQTFGRNRRRETAPHQTMNMYNTAPPPRRRSFFGVLMRLLFAVAGGIAIAQAAAPFLFRRGFRDFDRFDGAIPDIRILALTVGGTILVWMILSVFTRR
jgi:hypothetical protein